MNKKLDYKKILKTKRLTFGQMFNKLRFKGTFDGIIKETFKKREENKALKLKKKQEEKALEGQSFDFAVDSKLTKKQNREEFIANCYKNSSFRYYAFLTMFIIVQIFTFFTFGLDKGFLYYSFIAFANLLSVVSIITYSYQCYTIKNRELYIFKKFLGDCKYWFPRKI